ncbi:hypothetical protein GPECTOR_22g796 [Gonium pectorale]|uniref:RING-type domain-containing protein n=1 Tax=Gonium pectorale TaxID=33097 RepID=A0A150GH98_GONPE|nr:hypothetical protein GPECTOR_22g796 [Gonium pectorale]|eukprot:KXZ49206.1 hypothetical protein GPECTOR_22g796 [Gonium pectorale]
MASSGSQGGKGAADSAVGTGPAPPAPSSPPPRLLLPAGAAEAALICLSCPICCDVLLDPVVTPCGHAYCRDCFQAWRQHAAASWHTLGPLAGRLHCPLCRAPLPRSFNLHPGNASGPAEAHSRGQVHPQQRHHDGRPGEPLSPCAALAEAVALLCPEQLRERQRRRQLEMEARAEAARSSDPPSGSGVERAGRHQRSWGRSSGATEQHEGQQLQLRQPGGGIGGARRRLRRWLAGGWRRLAAVCRLLPPAESLLSTALLGLYIGTWTSIAVRSVADARIATACWRLMVQVARARRTAGGCGGGGFGGGRQLGVFGVGRRPVGQSWPWSWPWQWAIPAGWLSRPHAGLLPSLALRSVVWPLGGRHAAGAGAAEEGNGCGRRGRRGWAAAQRGAVAVDDGAGADASSGREGGMQARQEQEGEGGGGGGSASSSYGATPVRSGRRRGGSLWAAQGPLLAAGERL